MPLDLQRVLARLPGREVVWFDTAGSTMTEAAKLAAAGRPSGAAVVAEEQSAGQGRKGRLWHSERETGLYVSVILRLSPLPESMPSLTLALGLAVAEAIEHSAGVACDLRWPNDVLAGGKKCAGILTQLMEGAIIAGVGINVNQEAFPAELESIATSLRKVTGRIHSREDLLVQMLESMDAFCGILTDSGKEPIFRLFEQSSSYARGRRVVVEQEGSLLRGVTEGLDNSGFLVVRKDDGVREVIIAGSVRGEVA